MNHFSSTTSVYDPYTSQFLSPDPGVYPATQSENGITNPALSQDYNRYSYVRNNPLKHTDPSGYFVSGGWGYYDRNLSSYTKRLYEGRDSWNAQLDFIYHRGDYALGGPDLPGAGLSGGFGGTTAFYNIGGMILGVGSFEGGLFGDDFVKKPQCQHY
jgi:RHS repeat-associated protein